MTMFGMVLVLAKLSSNLLTMEILATQVGIVCIHVQQGS